MLKQLLDAAKGGTLIVRYPHTDLPYRSKEHWEFYETVGVSDLNRYFEAAGAAWRLDNGGETADRLFETEWWNLYQVLAWVYLGDRALVREGAVMREGAGFAMRLIVEAANRPGRLLFVVFPSPRSSNRGVADGQADRVRSRKRRRRPERNTRAPVG